MEVECLANNATDPVLSRCLTGELACESRLCSEHLRGQNITVPLKSLQKALEEVAV
jgi:hypothetical protein